MAHDPRALGPVAGSPTERLRRGKAASPWQERGTSANSPLAPAPRRRSPRRAPARTAHTAPRVYADTRTADTVSGALAARGCWDGVMAETATRASPVPARELHEQRELHQRHVWTRRRHL
ncbi:hypothetical protein GCM10010330_21170 [Streptomyces tendae]|nr:hypothetical protein GCM10010330_21170 [Streptomyces tendae]